MTNADNSLLADIIEFAWVLAGIGLLIYGALKGDSTAAILGGFALVWARCELVERRVRRLERSGGQLGKHNDAT